jgi:hypothetical protein
MSNKKGDLITPNTVVAILFLILTIVVISILAQWWKAYNSRGILPAERSIDLLQKNINLMSENDKNPRIVPIQTNLYSIRTVGDCNEEVTDKDGKPKTAYCICICTEDSGESCINSQDNKEKYCRLTVYKTDINLEKIEQVKNYVLDLAGSGEDAVITVKQYG